MTASGIAAPTAIPTEGSVTDVVTNTSKPVNVSAIVRRSSCDPLLPPNGLTDPVPMRTQMASICSLLFVIALLVGYHGVKEKLARQREQSTMKPSSWTGGRSRSRSISCTPGRPTDAPCPDPLFALLQASRPPPARSSRSAPPAEVDPVVKGQADECLCWSPFEPVWRRVERV
jgi:hypothetical protein